MIVSRQRTKNTHKWGKMAKYLKNLDGTKQPPKRVQHKTLQCSTIHYSTVQYNVGGESRDNTLIQYNRPKPKAKVKVKLSLFSGTDTF